MDPTAPPTWQDFVDGWELFREPVLAAAIAGIVLGWLSVFVVLRRMVFLSAAVTQAAGFGVALAFYLGIHHGVELAPSTVAVATSLVVAIALVFEPRSVGLSREVVLAFGFLVAAGGAVLLGSRITQEAHNIQAILFGTGVVITPDDYHRILWAAAVLAALHLWAWPGLTFASFDGTGARVQGLPVRVLDAFLLVSIGVFVGISARALGALPVFALSTLPGAAAVLVAGGRLKVVFPLAAALGAAAGVGGYLFAFFRGFPVGGSQTAFAAAELAVGALIAGMVGLVRRRR